MSNRRTNESHSSSIVNAQKALKFFAFDCPWRSFTFGAHSEQPNGDHNIAFHSDHTLVLLASCTCLRAKTIFLAQVSYVPAVSVAGN